MSQIIDPDAHLSTGLSDYLRQLGILAAGNDYHVVSVIGAQSSGKSTLLNCLFGTKFETLNNSTGRHQTTLGIHADYSPNQCILILDVEGADSRERGDADSLFERKSALFALALSEVMIVNVSVNDIGRYQASGMPLLKTIFEVNFQLFQTKSGDAKCHLFFVVRDVAQSQEAIGTQVRKDLELIWRSLVLPKEFQHFSGRSFDEFFVFHYFPLPHFNLQGEKFREDIIKLQTHFCDPESADFLFKGRTGKIVPAEVLPDYIRGVWEAINENRELNLPSQRKTLSIFRCDAFVKQALADFADRIDLTVVPRVREPGGMTDFGPVVSDTITGVLAFYDNESARYVPEIVDEKRSTLKKGIGARLSGHFAENCRRAREVAEQAFGAWLDEWREFPESGWRDAAEQQLNASIAIVEERIKVSQVPDFHFEFEELKEFRAHLTDILSERELRLVSALERSVGDRWAADHKQRIAADFEEASPEMWANLRHKLREDVESAQQDFRARLYANLPESTPIERSLTAIENQLSRATTSRALFDSKNVSMKILTKFDNLFLLDHTGQARQWPNEPEIAGLFEMARDQSLEVLRMFSACQLREKTDHIVPDDPLTQQLIGPAAMEIYEASFQRVIEQKYIEAVRIREVSRNRAQIRPWMIVLYVLLGAPKLITVIKHPYISLPVLLVALVIWVLYQRHVLDAPITAVRNWGTVALKWTVDKLLAGRARKRKKRAKPRAVIGKEDHELPAAEADRARRSLRIVRAKSTAAIMPVGRRQEAFLRQRKPGTFNPEPT
jgi:hypothetical protein